jgi:hypothetical protein
MRHGSMVVLLQMGRREMAEAWCWLPMRLVFVMTSATAAALSGATFGARGPFLPSPLETAHEGGQPQ